MMNTQSLIEFYGLLPHPEGGYYKETYRFNGIIEPACLPSAFGEARSFSTAIYFLLPVGNFSALHRIKSDEIWHFYEGCPLHIHVIHPNGTYELMVLGNDHSQGQSFQLVVPAHAWFASEPVGAEGEFSFVGCTVAPGFDFADFELADADHLSFEFPNHKAIIQRLSR